MKNLEIIYYYYIAHFRCENYLMKNYYFIINLMTKNPNYCYFNFSNINH